MNKIVITLLFFIVFSSQNSIAQEAESFYNPDSIRTLNIHFEQENWTQILDSLRLNGDELLVGRIEIDGTTYADAGMRWHETRSFSIGKNRNPLYIVLNYIHKNQNHQGYKKLKLSAAVRDPSMVREVLGFQIARKYIPTPQANYAKVNINGKYYGLFVNIEDVNSDFLEKNYGSAENSFFKCTPKSYEGNSSSKDCKNNLYASLEYEEKASCYPGNFEIRSKDGWDDLIELTRVLNNDIEKIESVLNVDRTLWMLAFNNVVVNLSSYTGFNSQNYFLYKDNKGQFNPIIWDLNLAFGSLKTVGAKSDLSIKELQKLDPLLHENNELKPLIHKLLSVPLYKKIYLNHIRTIVYDNFDNDWYEKEAEELQTLISEDLANDPNKEYSMEEFEASMTSTIGKRSKIPGISELMSKRIKFLKKHDDVAIFPPTVEDLNVVAREKFSNDLVKDFKISAKVENRVKRVMLYYRYNSDELYREVYMIDDGQHNDGEAGDKVFGIQISPEEGQDRIEYFILAENIASAGFSPADYMHNPFSSSLKELNK